MTRTEYIVVILLLVFLGLSMYISNDALTKVEKAGGWSEVFIGIGKEIKHINEEIEKD